MSTEPTRLDYVIPGRRRRKTFIMFWTIIGILAILIASGAWLLRGYSEMYAH